MHRYGDPQLERWVKKVEMAANLTEFNKALLFEDFHNFSRFAAGQFGHTK